MEQDEGDTHEVAQDHSASDRRLSAAIVLDTAREEGDRNSSGDGSGSGSGRRRKQWNEVRRRKEPSLYDEYLNQEKTAKQVHTPRRTSLPLRSGATSTSGPASTRTIRSVTPGLSGDESAGRQTPDITRPLGALSKSPMGTPARHSRRLTSTGSADGDEEWKRDARIGSHSPPSSREGSSVASMLARNGSRGDRHRTATTERSEDRETQRAAKGSARPRTRTLDDRRHGNSPAHVLTKRHRMGSVDITGSSAIAGQDAGSSGPAPSSTDDSMRRFSASTAEDDHPEEPPMRSTQARRILGLMRTLRGSMKGTVELRRHAEAHWIPSYCYIHEETGALMAESKKAEGDPSRTLVSSLRGCTVRPRLEGESPYLEVSVNQVDQEIHIRPLTQEDFDGWYAALMYWLDPEHEGGPVLTPRPLSSPSSPSDTVEKRPQLPPRTSSRLDRAGSRDRRASGFSSLKEAPVIKIGKMIYWEANSESSTGGGVASAGRPLARRTQSMKARRWRRISGQLRENGELKLHADADNSLISVVQLSQLSRCAIQRLDRSVLEADFCIAIYPQYTSNPADPQPAHLRPIYLGLEDRVLYEVWFVLLRAFTIPQLYGPRLPTGDDGESGDEGGQDLEDLLAASTADMFRMERTLSIRVIEAKMYPSTSTGANEQTGHSKVNAKSEHSGYYAEVLLDSETRGKTTVKFEGFSPLWGESFEFLDLPSVLNSASVVIKRRPGEHSLEGRKANDPYGASTDQYGGFTGITSDVTCGKVEIYLQELEEGKEMEKWWPVLNAYNQRVGEVLIKAQAEEGVILMARDYEPLAELLHRFSNGLTLQMVQMVPNELKRISECLLNIFQVSGRASEWLMSLIEDEIDGVHKEALSTRLRYSKRLGSDAANDALAAGASSSERELIVRDMNRNAALEANLLFRGNTLLTKALDGHMRRVGKEYLAESIAAKIKEINDKDPDCEVDPNRVPVAHDLERNWRRLLRFTQEIWSAIVNTRQRCPIELRLLFKHIRACAEDRYGDFLRSVSFSSVSGFLFLRFFCPAILNPKLFGLLHDEIRPRARRTFVLIAKSLQTLANMASFGTKETWMEPMNAFLTQHRENFKSFVNDICYIPTPLLASVGHDPSSLQPSYTSSLVSAETHLSYTTPMTIMQRLPPTSREGFPSLPYLIDQARSYAELVQMWLEATSTASRSSDESSPPQSPRQIVNIMRAAEGELLHFHETCTSLYERTQECLSRAERAERPQSGAGSFQWDELIDQLQPTDSISTEDDREVPPSFETFADDPSHASSTAHLPPWRPPPLSTTTDDDDASVDDDAHTTRLYDPTPPTSNSTSTAFSALELLNQVARERPWSAGKAAVLRDSLRKARSQSRGSTGSPARPTSASTSTFSHSSPSSDTERPVATPTSVLPSYQRAQRREAAAQVLVAQQIQAANRSGEVRSMLGSPITPRATAAQERWEPGKEKFVSALLPGKKKKTPIVAALRKTRQKEQLLQETRRRGSAPAVDSAGNVQHHPHHPSPPPDSEGGAGSEAPAASGSTRMGAYNGRRIRGVDMSFV